MGIAHTNQKLNCKKSLAFVFFFITLFCFGQQTIKGIIKDNNGETILAASIILKSETDQIITYTFTNDQGQFQLKTNKLGKYILFINAMAYEQKKIEITLEQNTSLNFNFFLIPKTTELKEIIIQSKRPITIKKDTIIILADAYRQGNEQVLEDLLKKIPGLSIDSDGKIKVGNQEVEKVMIEGDDFFEKGYRLLTKNMPANPIDKVEIYQRYSNNKHLKGIEESEKIALNLTLKEDYKRQWFGNMTLGYGLISENIYEIRANLMNFGKKSKYYFLTNLNNIGADAVGDINHLIRPFRFDDPGSIGDDQNAKSLLGLGFSTPPLKAKRVNFNNAEMLSLNTIFTLSDKVKLKLLGFVNTDENDFFRNTFQSFLLNGNTFENNEDFVGRKKQVIGFGRYELVYDVAKNKTLEITGKYNHTNENSNSDLSFNNNLLNEKLTANNQLIDQKILFTNKFKENKVLLLTARYIKEKTPQSYTLNQFIFDDLFVENANKTKQFSQNSMLFGGLEAHVLNKKKNGDLFEFKFGHQMRIDQLDSRFDLLANNEVLATPQLYSNQLIYKVNDLSASARYRFKLGNFTLLTQSSFHQLFNDLENFNIKKSQTPFYIVPKIGLDWKINEKNKVNTSYSYNTTNAGILDVYSGYIQSGFRSFSKGLEEFNQLTASNASLNYTHGSWSDKFFANIFMMYSKNHDFYSNNSIIAPNFDISEKIIIKNRELLTISSTIDSYIRSIKSNLKINLSASQTNFKNIINNSNLREIKSINFDYGFEIRSGFTGIFNYHLGSKWLFNQIKTSIENDFTNQISFLDLSFVFNEKFNIQIQSERYLFGNLEKDNSTYYFLDFDARYTIKTNKLTLFLTGNNLFNTQTFKNYSISDINISKTEFRLLPRYVLLKMEYRF